MKKAVIFILSVILILVGIFLLVKVAADAFAPKGKGALQVTTNVKAAIFLDNKPVGNSPLCLCEQNQIIEASEHDLKIVPEDTSLQSFSVKIKINKGVLTAVERTFLPGALSSSYILTLEKENISEPQVFIASIPEGALITIDGESKGVTPLLVESISESEHEVIIQKQGFAKKTVRIRTVPGHKLVLNIILGTDAGEETLDSSQNSSEPTPTSSPLPIGNTVTIGNTPTGFLRVRAEESTSASEIGRVNPGESYELVEESDSWYKIKLENGEEGWISKTYATTSTEEEE